jgi:hypothetical protein
MFSKKKDEEIEPEGPTSNTITPQSNPVSKPKPPPPKDAKPVEDTSISKAKPPLPKMEPKQIEDAISKAKPPPPPPKIEAKTTEDPKSKVLVLPLPTADSSKPTDSTLPNNPQARTPRPPSTPPPPNVGRVATKKPSASQIPIVPTSTFQILSRSCMKSVAKVVRPY